MEHRGVDPTVHWMASPLLLFIRIKKKKKLVCIQRLSEEPLIGRLRSSGQFIACGRDRSSDDLTIQRLRSSISVDVGPSIILGGTLD